ncbi:hypothetical protein B0J11DRAFT_406036, partial [Dendryphion nanum]
PGTIDAGRTRIPGTIQICGLVAGYVGSVLIWGFLLLTIGRRMRRKNQTVPKTLELELVTARPSGHALASPLSARSATSWFKKGFKKNDGTNDSVLGSQPQTPVHISSPTTMDKRTMEIERERAQAEMERLYAAVAEHDKQKHMSQVSNTEQEVETAPRRPAPRINTARKGSFNSNPSSPVVAIYPPSYQNMPNNSSPPRDRIRDQPVPASPRSILSKKSHNSTSSNTSKARFNLKNLRISGPIQRYPGGADDEEARTPLSPRFYNPPAPPSPPTQQNSPTTPGDFEAYEQLDEVQPLPRPAPQRLGSYGQTPTTPNFPVPSKSTNSSTNELPLRGYAEPLKSPDLRTTVLDRQLNKLALNTPKTSVPYTPYSPYMPFTPLTPVTPHLVTRTERKQRKKRELAPQSLDEMVQSPKEIFGDAY